MKTKFILSSFVLLLFSLLAGGSTEGEEQAFITTIVVLIATFFITAIITAIVKEINKNKRLKMIEKDEQESSDFDRSVSIGDDRCKLYFDASQKKVMIMRIMTEGIIKKYVDDFEFPGKELATYSGFAFNVYDPTRRKLLTGTYNDNDIHVTSIAEKDKNKDITINNTIQPVFRKFKLYNVLIDESHGLMAISEYGRVRDVFNYINARSLPNKKGNTSTLNTRDVGSYLFIMDKFFKVLVIIGSGVREIFNYSDIIEVSCEENGNLLYTKSAGRTVGGAIVGGVLMGGAGAVVGGLSGASKQNKEIKNLDIKILLRSTSKSSCILHFNEVGRVLKTKDNSDRALYETYVKNANQAKDILSVIIDDAKRTGTQIVSQPIASQPSSVADELTKLAKLKADGILTEDEFATQKKLLLGGNTANKNIVDNNAVTESKSEVLTEYRHICGVCGYIMDGEVTPEKCPQCKSPSTKFKVI